MVVKIEGFDQLEGDSHKNRPCFYEIVFLAESNMAENFLFSHFRWSNKNNR